MPLKGSLPYHVHRRELQENVVPAARVRSLYGNPRWIEDLDIVNELDGHSGCVNALSWSKSGRLLASGSDDQHLNIHAYNPIDSDSQFSLVTTVATGHTANIFSVKFMPHSNDRTLITAAGDSQVRIFDLEYAGASRAPSAAANMATHGRRRGRNNIYNGVRYLSDGDTNCRVYRSHGDRVKRIVTESSPHLFLTCSEDGEVRQWDLRQPSSFYPSPRSEHVSEDDIPPPLISYKHHLLDLNTISCSPSQPHYIALGGAHLHCFLHDRRMLGRNRLQERGISSPGLPASDGDEQLMGQATQCVKKFAPNGQKKMRQKDNGHITACKISDANPNEMIVSWSGDHVYNFDLLRSPDADETGNAGRSPVQSTSGVGLRDQERKRKRLHRGDSSLSSHHSSARMGSRPRTESAEGDIALRVQYQNGQSEDIPIDRNRASDENSANTRQATKTPQEKLADTIARKTVKIRQNMFTLQSQRPQSGSDPTGYATSFTSVLGFSANTLREMKHTHSTWQYPVSPIPVELSFQRTLRCNRESAMCFVQAAGVVARALGGKLRSTSIDNSDSDLFQHVDPLSNAGPDSNPDEHFYYDFLRAIFLWLESGVGALLDGFTKSAGSLRVNARRPVPQDSSVEAIDEHLIPYLLERATNRPIYNVDASRFEVDENRIAYNTGRDAVLAFATALRVPFADLSSTATASSTPATSDPAAQDRSEAFRHWGFVVARGVLMNAGEGICYPFVNSAFGGTGQPDVEIAREEAEELRRHEIIDPDIEELQVQSMEVVAGHQRDVDASPPPSEHSIETDDDLVRLSDIRGSLENDESHDEDDDDDDDDDDDNDDEDDEDDDDDDQDEDDDDEDMGIGLPRRVFRSVYDRSRLRQEVEEEVPCAPHTRVYKGHCNVKTVKDVNFFGMDDEYVVSGSDDGNLFIWDRKTSKLVNILEGDGEVVNVLQGHPYETTLAVSGIDHTIKIFSPDSRARRAARLGLGIGAADSSAFSSLSWPLRIGGRAPPRRGPLQAGSEPAVSRDTVTTETETPDEEDEEFVAPNGLASRKRYHDEYRITSHNANARQGGNQEAYITRSMLAQLATQIRRRRAEAGEEAPAGFGALGGPIEISDDCNVM